MTAFLDRMGSDGISGGEMTPGPWTASHNGTCWQIDAAMDAVATTQFCYAPETEANARAMAAAPDLLTALKDILRIARAATMHSGGDGNRKRIARAEDAIAKATGGKS